MEAKLEEKVTLLREFAGFISADIPELHAVEVPRIGESVERFLRASAPAAPVTVTVLTRRGVSVEWTRKEPGSWHSNHGTWVPSDHIASELFHRIAADARRIEELEAANASLKAEIDRIGAMRQDALGELVRVGHERDEARRLYAESEATSQGERLGAPASTSDEAPNSEVTGGGIAAASPAPIPLGARVALGELEWTREASGWSNGEYWHHDLSAVARTVAALYHAQHPVGTPETVERVAKAIHRHSSATPWEHVGYPVQDHYRVVARAALRALNITIQEGEA